MNQILYSKKNNNKRTKIIVLVFCVFITLLIVLSVSFGIANKTNDRILKGVYINNIYVGELSKEEALTKIDAKIEDIKNMKLTLNYNDYSKVISGGDVGAHWPSDLVEKAYEYGRAGNILNDNYTVLRSYFDKRYEVNANLLIDDSKYDEIVAEINNSIGKVVKNDEYTITDSKIILSKGKRGISIKNDELKNYIVNSLSENGTTINIPVESVNPLRVSFEELYNETYVEKVEASYNATGTFEVIKEVYGKYFDKDSAIEQYSSLQDGENMEIKFVIVEPEVKVSDLNDVLFKNVLATYQTKYDQTNTNRAINLGIAAKNINGTILYPGDEFSYNKVVGERTVSNGFKEAHVFAGGRVVDGLGGGICQVSSTLYNSVLLSNLEVTERKAHMMHTGYVDPGRDATVVYGSIDFRFKNNRKTPIKIETVVKNGICTATIYGLKEDDEPKVEIKTKILKVIPYTTITENDNTLLEGTTQVVQSPLNGYVSETYKILKDSNGKEISNTLISKDSYNQTSKIVNVGTKKVEVPVEPPIENTENQSQEENQSTLPTGWDNPESPYNQ